jgi:hypothetical protein
MPVVVMVPAVKVKVPIPAVETLVAEVEGYPTTIDVARMSAVTPVRSIFPTELVEEFVLFELLPIARSVTGLVVFLPRMVSDPEVKFGLKAIVPVPFRPPIET